MIHKRKNKNQSVNILTKDMQLELHKTQPNQTDQMADTYVLAYAWWAV